jgi:uncharacterized membrane protein
MIFFEGNSEVDLDEMAAKFKKVNSQAKAKNHPIPLALADFDTKVNALLVEKKCYDAVNSKENRFGLLMVAGFFAFFFVMCAGIDALGLLFYYFDLGNIGAAAIVIASMATLAGLSGYCAYKLLQPAAPKGYEKEFELWDAFARGLKSSRIKEYPPSSVIIWGKILVYATALGLAGKVKKHLSELDALTAKRMEAMEEVRGSSYVFYASAIGISNLGKYGNRQGFSSRSSGGWSSGGGGFSGGGSSGGGGFR